MSDKKASWKSPFFSMKFVAILLIGILLIGIYTFTGSNSQTIPGTSSQPRITSYTDKTLNLKHFSLEPSKYTLVGVWASWCPTCKPELSALNKLREPWSKKNINIVAVNVDPEKNQNLVQEIWSGLNLDLPLIKIISSDFLTDFEIQVLPSYFLIQNNQMLILKIDGASDWSDPKIQSLILDQIKY
jgi:thiol-disulfide isomerase/thioredoxin